MEIVAVIPATTSGATATGSCSSALVQMQPARQQTPQKLQCTIHSFFPGAGTSPKPAVVTITPAKRGRPCKADIQELPELKAAQEELDALVQSYMQQDLKFSAAAQLQGAVSPQLGGCKRGVAGGAESNRRAPGEKPLKRELNAAHKYAMCCILKKMKHEFPDEEDFWREACKRYHYKQS